MEFQDIDKTIREQIIESVKTAMEPVITRMVADFEDTLRKKTELEVMRAVHSLQIFVQQESGPMEVNFTIKL